MLGPGTEPSARVARFPVSGRTRMSGRTVRLRAAELRMLRISELRRPGLWMLGRASTRLGMAHVVFTILCWHILCLVFRCLKNLVFGIGAFIWQAARPCVTFCYFRKSSENTPWRLLCPSPARVVMGVPPNNKKALCNMECLDAFVLSLIHSFYPKPSSSDSNTGRQRE